MIDIPHPMYVTIDSARELELACKHDKYKCTWSHVLLQYYELSKSALHRIQNNIKQAIVYLIAGQDNLHVWDKYWVLQMDMLT